MAYRNQREKERKGKGERENSKQNTKNVFNGLKIVLISLGYECRMVVHIHTLYLIKYQYRSAKY